MMKTNRILMNFWLYLWAIFIIFNCFSVYTRELGGNTYRNLTIVNAVFGISAIIYGLISLYLTKSNIKNLIIYLLLYLLIITPYVYSNYLSTGGYFTVYTLILTPSYMSIFLYAKFEEKRLWDLFVAIRNIVIIMAFVSVFFWLFASNLKLIPFNNSILIEWGGVHQFQGFKFLYYDIQHIVINGINIARNSGIFVEPATWGLVLNISYMIGTLVCNKDYHSIGNIILGITIITTTSTTNIIVFVVTLLINYINNSKRDTIQKYIMPFFLLFGFLIVLQIFSSKTNSQSYSFRMDDLQAGIMSFKDHMFWGNGFGNTSSVVSYINSSRIFDNQTGFSNGLLLVFVQGGVYLGILYFIPLLSTFFAGIKHKNIKITSFPILMIILAFSTMAQYSELNILILVLCLFIPKYLKNISYEEVVI